MNRRSNVTIHRAARRPSWRASVLLGALLLSGGGRRDAADRSWVAKFDQPCDGVQVGAYVLEVTDGRGDDVRGRLVIEASGCGPQSVDIAALVPAVDPRDPAPAVLRVWSVSADGVQSEAFDWVLIDPTPECVGQTRTSQDGNVNGDHAVDLSDAIAIASYLFTGGVRPCSNAADANNDGRVDLADVVSVLDRLFGDGGGLARMP